MYPCALCNDSLSLNMVSRAGPHTRWLMLEPLPASSRHSSADREAGMHNAPRYRWEA